MLSLRNCLQMHYQLLDAMGISYWMSLSHPMLSALLISHKPIFCAACLVLLPEKLISQEVEQTQILNGMCEVLELKEDELCVAWIKADIKLEEWVLIDETIARWAPYSVLIMGEVFAKRLLQHDATMEDLRMDFQKLPRLEAILQVTYHPCELQQNKAYKRKAYEDLLRLKEHLALVRVS